MTIQLYSRRHRTWQNKPQRSLSLTSLCKDSRRKKTRKRSSRMHCSDRHNVMGFETRTPLSAQECGSCKRVLSLRLDDWHFQDRDRPFVFSQSLHKPVKHTPVSAESHGELEHLSVCKLEPVLLLCSHASCFIYTLRSNAIFSWLNQMQGGLLLLYSK